MGEIFSVELCCEQYFGEFVIIFGGVDLHGKFLINLNEIYRSPVSEDYYIWNILEQKTTMSNNERNQQAGTN